MQHTCSTHVRTEIAYTYRRVTGYKYILPYFYMHK